MSYQNITNMYQNDLIPMIDIAAEFNVTSQTIYRLLRKLGINTSKSRRIEVECNWCEKDFLKRPSEVRRHNHHYCTFGCYLDYIKEIGQPYVQNRHGQRRARATVSRYFDLKDDMIVHHENKDTLDPRPTNLRVFKNHSEHMRYHRGGEATPIWDGRDIKRG